MSGGQKPIHPGKSQALHPLIAAMMDPAFYPHRCDRVEPRETLRSWLFFAGEFVYKVKKPLRLSFCDASTPARRFNLCRQEIELNRRLAPDVYLGIRAIAANGGSYAFVAESNDLRAREFAVMMRRLPAPRMLDQMIDAGLAGAAEMRETAHHLAAFHARASTAQAVRWGSAQAIYQQLAELGQVQTLLADNLARSQLAAIQASTRGYVIAHRQSLDNRLRDGRVREGHGDLRCKSICFVPEGIVIIDCAECSENRRYMDVAADVAALAVDLEMLERPELADDLIAAYVAETRDSQLSALLGFYGCYQAAWRGLVATLTSVQGQLPSAMRMAARGEARQLFALAQGYANSLSTSAGWRS